MAYLSAPRTRNDFKVAIICALPIEAENVQAIFDRCWDDEGQQYGKTVGDQNEYTTGAIGRCHVVLVHMPDMGSSSTSQAAANLRSSYPGIELVLVVGICGVAPVHPQTQDEIVLGDIVISTAVSRYDFGRQYPEKFQGKKDIDNSLGRASPAVRALINRLQTRQNRQRMTTNLMQLTQSNEFKRKIPISVYPGASQDWLYEASYMHQHRPPVDCTSCNDDRETCSKSCYELGCEEGKRIARSRHHHPKTEHSAQFSGGAPIIHFGRFGSANTVMKSGIHRDELSMTEKIAALEMEAAGVWEQYPTVVIKSASDYADSHKNKVWQPYAAAMAAGCVKVFLGEFMLVDEPVRCDDPKSLGMCLSSAPYIQPDLFIGRAVEIDRIHKMLQPQNALSEQRRVILGGIGGIGKTQLAIAYARQHGGNYTSVLWLNATSGQTLHASLQSVAEQLVTANELENLDQEQVQTRVRKWLLHPHNTQWLLIFDNYDTPDQFELSCFYPNTSYGSVIVTTRLPDMVDGELLRVQPLAEMDYSLDILQGRSGRQDVKNDAGARALAKRFAGLPIALVTAGAYLRNNNVTFQEYLDSYRQCWQVGRRTLSLREYQDRTLYNTWNLTYSQLVMIDAEAAQMLKLLAYFDHQEIWYELFQAGLPEQIPAWLPKSLANRIDFGDMMGTLVKYGLVEVHHVTQSYSMYSIHSCVHDWMFGTLSQVVESRLYWYAFDCVVANTDDNDCESLRDARYTRISHHALRLTHHRFDLLRRLDSSPSEYLHKAIWIAEILLKQFQVSIAEQIYAYVLARHERLYGPKHDFTLSIAMLLGCIYTNQGKFELAEQMCLRALAGYEQSLGPENLLTLNTLYGLGVLYFDQGRFERAEQMFLRALAGYQQLLVPDLSMTLNTTNNLGLLYVEQGKLEQGEKMYLQALAGKERLLGPNHRSTFYTINNLGNLYRERDELEQAEQMYRRALTGFKESLGSESAVILMMMNNLGRLYVQQGRLEEAEKVYRRVLDAQLNGSTSAELTYAKQQLAVTLNKAIHIQNRVPTVTQKALVRVIQHAERWARSHRSILYVLGNALVCVKDEEDASIACLLFMSQYDGMVDSGSAICDGCDHAIVLAKGHHVCRQCEDVDLCDDCMAKYVVDDITLTNCHGHEYCDIGSKVTQLLHTSLSWTDEEMELWLAKLRQKYQV